MGLNWSCRARGFERVRSVASDELVGIGQLGRSSRPRRDGIRLSRSGRFV